MKKYAKPLRFALALLPVALAAGWFTAQYSLDALSGAMMEEMIRQAGSPEAARTITVAVTVAQTVLYALVCGFFGYVLAEKLGLMRPFRPGKRETVLVEAVSTRDSGSVGGKTPRGMMVNFPGKPDLIGRFVDVELTSAGRNTLRGRMI